MDRQNNQRSRSFFYCNWYSCGRYGYFVFLQSYEISLIAQTLLEACEKCPNLFVLNHLHDRVTVLFPKSIPLDVVQELLNSELKQTTQRLGLLFAQSFEPKVTSNSLTSMSQVKRISSLNEPKV